MIDIQKNRAARKYSNYEMFGRILWTFGQLIFLCVPRPLWSLRRVILRCFGARIGKHVHIYSTVKIMCPWNLAIGDYSAVGDGVILYCLGKVSIGSNVTISQYSHLCAGTHDYTTSDMKLLKEPVSVGDATWICASSFIGPGVMVGEKNIVGACCVLTFSTPPNVLVVGNPAIIKRTLN